MTSSNILWPRMIAEFILFAFVVCFAVWNTPSALAGEMPRNDHIHYCGSGQEKDTYFSAVFDAGGAIRQNIEDSFFALLQQKYSYKGFRSGVNCAGYQNAAAAQSAKTKDMGIVRGQGKHVVETGWTYRGTKAIVSAPPEAVVPAQTHSARAPKPGPSNHNPGGGCGGLQRQVSMCPRLDTLQAVANDIEVWIFDRHVHVLPDAPNRTPGFYV